MNKLILGNWDYRNHMTDEGYQLERGLQAAGWRISGRYQEIDEVDVPTILKRWKPELVFVQDPRDWALESDGCFNKSMAFQSIQNLAYRKDIFKIVSFKDAGSGIDFQQRYIETIGANLLSCYYHDRSILALSPWAERYRRVRTYHSVDKNFIDGLPLTGARTRGLVSGAYSSGQVYPDRAKIFNGHNELDVVPVQHPGYHNHGSHTQEYLRLLTTYKVSVATASAFGFALRKIIEAVCCGCICVTNLPAFDCLPIIDEWLVRFPHGASIYEIRQLIDRADKEYNAATQHDRALIARHIYDYRAVGKRLDLDIMREFAIWKENDNKIAAEVPGGACYPL